MRRPEWIARTLIVCLLVAALAVPIILRRQSPLIHARMAESGGWSVDDLRAAVGVPLHLRLISDDVVHGFAVGKLGAPAADIMPGRITDVTLLFDQPGTYTFYCTRWCGLNHWRMRGTITVDGPAESTRAADQPLYASLSIDLDAPRSAPVMPVRRPVGEAPSMQIASELAAYSSGAYYRSHSPAETWQALRLDPDLRSLEDDTLWDATAWIWKSNTTSQSVARGAQLFADNCAACHGQAGDGKGVFADDLQQAGALAMQSGMTGGTMSMQPPADLSDPARMLSASPALIQGKIVRGGMGTGMPSWGPIFTEEQTWDLVSYIYTFQFDYPWERSQHEPSQQTAP